MWCDKINRNEKIEVGQIRQSESNIPIGKQFYRRMARKTKKIPKMALKTKFNCFEVLRAANKLL